MGCEVCLSGGFVWKCRKGDRRLGICAYVLTQGADERLQRAVFDANLAVAMVFHELRMSVRPGGELADVRAQALSL